LNIRSKLALEDVVVPNNRNGIFGKGESFVGEIVAILPRYKYLIRLANGKELVKKRGEIKKNQLIKFHSTAQTVRDRNREAHKKARSVRHTIGSRDGRNRSRALRAVSGS